MDLNNRRTGKDATKPRALGLLGHSDFIKNDTVSRICEKWNLQIDLLL